MKSQQHHIFSSGVFSVIALLLLFSFQTSYSQETIIITNTGQTQVTIPAGATSITIEVWGAGGSGGGSKKNGAAGGGGGGAYSKSISGFSSGTYAIQIGQGAPSAGGNADGTAGGNTWFINASTVFADGGGGGLAIGTPGAGGNSPIGDDTTISGGNGVAGSGSQGGDGGDGANGGAGGAGGNTTSGSIGSPPGGAGGGGADRNATGGAGADGQIIITYTAGSVCNLTSTGLTNIICNNNGTPSNPADDTFTFDLNPTGTDLGATYNITGDITDSGTYGSVTNFGPYPISGGNLNITISDVSGGCSIGETVTAPATCSTVCNLASSGLANIICDDNGTPSIPGDDTFSFDLNPTGANLGATFSVTGDVTQSGISYGTTNFGPYPISGGNLSITITDDADGTCTIAETVTAPATCSGAVCNLTASGLANIICDDNGTPTLPGDDTFSFDLNPTGTILGATYSISGDVTQSGISYGATNFGPYPISGGNLNITITDVDDGSCTFAETVTAPAPCSTPVCDITSSGLNNITCNNNGTTANPADDVFYFDLNPTGTILGASYNISGDVTQSGISYGSATNFGPFPISGGNLNITLTDVSTDCSFGPFTVIAPATCSADCNLSSAGLSNIYCNWEDTVLNNSDDTFTFSLNPTGSNLGGTYSVSGDVSGAGTYGSATTFSGYLIADGDLTITITDDSDGSCQIIDLLVTAPSPCSQNHEITECSSCHITHASPGNALTNATGNALLCQSCHANGMLASNKPLLNGNKAIPDVSGNSHAWNVPAVNSAYQTNTPSDSQMSLRLPEGNIICSTCHNQHKNGSAGAPYLRVDNTGDAICKDCHLPRDVQRFQDGASNKGSHPVGVVYDGGSSKLNASPTNNIQVVDGKVECSSCHGVHDVAGGVLTTDGNLLRTPKGNSLCMDCHNYPTHNSMDCLDCHEVHNTVDGTLGNNIYMIKDQIIVTTPAPASASINSSVVFTAESGVGSFVDSVGGDDGICEVCHTTTTHHTSDGGNITHDDATDKRGTNCVGCHFHNVGFETPTGPQTCVSCHSSATSGGRGGTLQIVGAGGEMDNSLPSRHTASGIGVDPLNEECEACHYDSGITHPTSIMMLRDPGSNATWSGDMDVYCVKCHDGAPPAGTTFPGDDPIYNKSNFIGNEHDYTINSCQLCHNDHGSAYDNLLKQASNYDGCNACHSNSGDANTMSTDLWTSGGNSHAWDVIATNGTYDALPPTDPTMNNRLEGSNIVCSTCHDPHDNTNTNFLVNDNSSDGMCKDCHNPRDLGRFTDDINNNLGHHPVGLTYIAGGDYQDPAPTLSSTQVGLVNGKIECSSCHATHNATTTDGSLLRETMTNNTCNECHNYQPHQGFDCLDCHQSHNTTNIMLVSEAIDIDVTAGVNLRPVIFSSQGTDAIPTQAANKSFSDGDGTRDGICEVCHTTTLHHTNTDDGHNHYDGQDCTGCHAHNDATVSFPNASCHSCHESTGAGDPNLYPETGAHEAHSGVLYGYTCSECHFGLDDTSPGHADGTADVVFDPNGLASRFGLDAVTPTWNDATKTCSNIYCHSSGNTADRGTNVGQGFPTSEGWGDTYEADVVYASPVWTATITTCTACHDGVGTMTPPYKVNETLNPVSAVADYPATGEHRKGSHYDLSQNITYGNGFAPCFFCHNVEDPASVAITADRFQGTYGTQYHVDGETFFNPLIGNTNELGTMISPWSHAGDGSGGHCGKPTGSKLCW